MSTKTITIDPEAYTRLKRCKRSNESFSQTITRVVTPPLDVDRWLKRVRKNALSPVTVAAVECQVGRRRHSNHRK